jgi:hypothetical protein
MSGSFFTQSFGAFGFRCCNKLTLQQAFSHKQRANCNMKNSSYIFVIIFRRCGRSASDCHETGGAAE